MSFLRRLVVKWHKLFGDEYEMKQTACSAIQNVLFVILTLAELIKNYSNSAKRVITIFIPAEPPQVLNTKVFAPTFFPISVVIMANFVTKRLI